MTNVFKIQRYCCPTCGGYIGEVPNPDKVREVLSQQERIVFDALVEAMPLGLDKITLAIRLFGEDRGIQDRKINQAAVLISKLRRTLERFGYHIPRNMASERAVYKLLPLQAGA